MKMHVNPDKSVWTKLLERPQIENKTIDQTISIVFDEIKAMGDRAVKKNTLRFDKIELDGFRIEESEILEADNAVPRNLKSAIEIASNNIEKFHMAQREEVRMVETSPGVTCWRESKPIERVGIYVPGGSAPLFSTVLMLAIPARIAGCKEIVMCSPPANNGKIHPAILYAAKVAGVKKIFRIGGIQAIAAMTLGTETVPQCYKIFGPGNKYVTEAKRFAQLKGVSIDMPAGPSEVMILADQTADPEFVAADLLAQAEHGPDSQVVLVTFTESFCEKVITEIEKQLLATPRSPIATEALKHARFIVVFSHDTAVEMINYYAPEHLIINVEDEGKYLDDIINAGSVFLGSYTPESAGDYASGTNHTLPTSGYARAYSGVSLDSFVKKITFQRISPKGLQSLGPSIETMAEAEGLLAHKNAVSIRLKKLYRND